MNTGGGKSEKLSPIFLLVIFLVGHLAAQNEPDDKVPQPLKEYVQVSNVEMMLRVMKDGRTVGGFEKGDFILSEDGVERPINGFFELKKRMKPDPRQRTEPSSVPGRLFLIFFWASQSQTEFDAHLDAFFKDVYLPADRVILAGNDCQYDIRSSEQVSSARKAFADSLKAEIALRQGKWAAAHRDLLHEIEQMLMNIRLSKDVAGPLGNFSARYAEFLKEVELQNRSIDFQRLDRMAEELRAVNAAKWVLFFCESQRIPMVDSASLKSVVSAAADCDPMLIESWHSGLVQLELKMARMERRNPLSEALRSRFTQADTLFHFLNVDTPSFSAVRREEETPYLSFKAVGSDWENVLQSITTASGGQISSVRSDPAALTPLFEAEDVSYLLTYVPQKKGRTERKIELGLRRPTAEQEGMRLLYGRRIELDKTPALRIEHIGRSAAGLVLSCSDYHPVYTAAGPLGHLGISVSGKTKDGQRSVLFERDVEYADRLELPLQFPREGDWTLEVKVSDRMTGLFAQKEYSCTHIAFPAAQPVVVSEEKSPELAALLEKSARYCERLKRAALKFYCREKVTELFFANDRAGKCKVWNYDYQIVLQDGKLEETRTDARGRKKKGMVLEKKKLETVYHSYYSFFLPATFLSAERQTEYRYTWITEKKTWMPGFRIVAQPLKPQSGLPGGELWIDEQDGSVMAIKLDPYTVAGFLDRLDKENTKEKSATITDFHSYKKRYNGLRFPNRTLIMEHRKYKNDTIAPHGIYAQMFGPALYWVEFEYEKYRFFDVQADEHVTGWLED